MNGSPHNGGGSTAAHANEEEILSLSLSECADDEATVGRHHQQHQHHVGEDDEAAARASRSHFESTMESFAAANGLSTGADGGSGHDDLTPLAMPSSPSLLPLSGSPTLAMNMLGGAGGLADSNSVQSYFQHDPDGALAASVSNFTREFGDLQKSVSGLDDRRLADEISAKLEAQQQQQQHADGMGKTELKKRKAGGSNVSIDLQTKIRLIELAEEYQYDPKATARGKHEGGSSSNSSNVSSAKEQMSGIRLAAQFGLNKSTVSRILKRKDEFKKAYYKDNISGGSKHINKKSKFEKLNRLVENWFDMTREKKVAVSDTLIRDVGKRFAEELGIDDFRGSNGWVRSLRNRKENQARNMSVEALEREKVKKDAEAIERMRAVFPNGMKDMSGFFKDLSTFLEKDCGTAGGALGDSSNSSMNGSGVGIVHGADGATVGYTDMDDEDALKEEEKAAEEFLRKKMVESMRAWSHELMESELSRLKKRLKPRQIANL